MTELLQIFLERFALCGLLASLLAWLLFSAFRALRHVRIPASTACALLAAALVAIEVGGTKTNDPPSRAAGPQRSAPQISFAEWRAQNWNIRGAWKDSFRLDFGDDFVFPHGSNHLSGVEVVSFGQIWPGPFDTNAVASLGIPVEIVPGISSFAYWQTPSNSFRFAWTDCAVNRDTNELVSASIELFRNGDTAVETNGVREIFPRVLPFAHHGFGQDAEWVAANFTNASEILSAGYPQWVDAQVGDGLANGLYKLTASLFETPPETIRLAVGPYSVAVTNSGDYIFLLEKGVSYGLSLFPPLTNMTVSAVDDVPASRSVPALRSSWNWGNGVWSTDVGEFTCDYVPGMPSAVFWWLPSLHGSPDIAHIGPSDPQMEFLAEIFDCRHPENATFEWSVGEGLVAATPHAQFTLVTAVDIPSWRLASMSVSAFFGTLGPLTSYLDFTCGTNTTPQSGISLSIPRVMFENDDDDNDDGEVDYEAVNFGGNPADAEDDVELGHVVFGSDESTNGTVRISVSGFPGDVYTNDCEEALAPDSFDVAVEGETARAIDFYLNPISWSPYQAASVTAVWIPEGGDPRTSSVPFTVVKPVAEPICSDTVVHSALGTNHVYTVNPCAVAVGDDAYFRVEVSPASFPDSDIVWTNHGGRVRFIGGNTGRSVHVHGDSAGDDELEIIIGGRTRQAPAFPLKVVEPQAFKITAWIVSGPNDLMPRYESDIIDMIEPLNDIYRQVGVSFYLDSVTVTNIPDAYNLLYDSTTNDVWNFDRLVDIATNTGGIECYFVNSFIMSDGKKPPVAANNIFGLVLTKAAGVKTLAHEIGHAFGLSDVYVSADEKDGNIPPAQAKTVETNFVSEAAMSWDWNGGCHGGGEGGCRYYPRGTRMGAIIPRLLMYGMQRTNDNRRDITIGSIDGVNYIGDGDARTWYDSVAPVGFFENIGRKASPAHQ